MITSKQKSTHKIWHIFGTIICVIALLILVAWLFLRFWRAERVGTCSNGFTIWQVDPSSFSSYQYEIRDGVFRVEKGLTYKQLREFEDKYDCVDTLFQGG